MDTLSDPSLDPSAQAMRGPALAGVRVVDLTQFEAGTVCTEALAWLGADIIKVEPPGRGDPGRRAGAAGEKADSIYFLMLNANKRSVTLNLKEEKGRALLRQLIAKADVFIENFSPGAIERLGFDYETVKSINPSIIYTQIKGFAQDGPLAGLQAFDVTAQAMGGSMSLTGESDGPPLKPGIHLGDSGTGLHCVIGVLGALYQRKATGIGQRVEIAMQEAMISLARASYTGDPGKPAKRNGNKPHGHLGAPFGAFPCKDGGPNDYCFINIRPGDGAGKTAASGGSHQWESLLRVMGRADLIGDERYALTQARRDRLAEVNEIVSTWTRQFTKHEVMEKLTKVGVLASAIMDSAELSRDPHLRARGAFVTIDHPTVGQVVMPGFPIRLSELKVPVQAAPLLGAHNDAVYGELLGLSERELKELKDGAII